MEINIRDREETKDMNFAKNKMAWKSKLLNHVQLFCDLYIVHGILQARILEWVAVPFSGGSSQPKDRTQVFRTAGEFFTSWATKEALLTED